MEPFRASNIVPDMAYKQAKGAALKTRNFALQHETRLQSNVNADVIIMIYLQLGRAKDQLNAAKDVPGIVPYALIQEDDPSYDVGAAFLAIIAAAQDVRDNIVATFPVDAGGFLSEKKLLPSGGFEFRVFTPAQTATLRSLLATLAATVV